MQHYSIGVANVITGLFESYDETLSHEDTIKLLQASVTFSGVSPAVEALDSLFFAGGMIYENDVTAAINHCEEMGYSEDQIVIDTIISSPAALSQIDASNYNSF